MIAVILAAATPVPYAEPGIYHPCSQPSHYDGDDVRCTDPMWQELARKGGMRVAAIDAPEINVKMNEDGMLARDHLRDLTATGTVECAWTGTWAAGYGKRRPVVDCRLNGVDLACQLVEAGHAKWWPKFDPEGTRRANCKRLFP